MDGGDGGRGVAMSRQREPVVTHACVADVRRLRRDPPTGRSPSAKRGTAGLAKGECVLDSIRSRNDAAGRCGRPDRVSKQ